MHTPFIVWYFDPLLHCVCFIDPSWTFGLTGFHFSDKQSDLTATLSSETEGWNRQKTPHQQADRRAGRSPDKNANISAKHPCYDRLTRPSEKPLQILAHTKRSMYTHTQTWWCIIKAKSIIFLFQYCCFLTVYIHFIIIQNVWSQFYSLMPVCSSRFNLPLSDLYSVMILPGLSGAT